MSTPAVIIPPPKKHSWATDSLGVKYGRLTVLSVFRKGRETFARTSCSCGGQKITRLNLLRRGYTTSCGCFQLERIKESLTKHGCGRKGLRTPEYKVWMSMHSRCYNPKSHDFSNYGARGIEVCKRWEHFENFLTDMGQRPSPRHTIERTDNEAGYNPSNCVWATRTDQNRNRRNNFWFVVAGEKLLCAEVAKLLGVSRSAVQQAVWRNLPNLDFKYRGVHIHILQKPSESLITSK